MDDLEIGGERREIGKNSIDVITHRIERSNRRIAIASLPDNEKYLNGQIDYFFEFMSGGRNAFAEVILKEIWISFPCKIGEGVITKGAACEQYLWHKRIAGETDNLIPINGFIVFHWNQEPMFIDSLHLIY